MKHTVSPGLRLCAMEFVLRVCKRCTAMVLSRVDHTIHPRKRPAADCRSSRSTMKSGQLARHQCTVAYATFNLVSTGPHPRQQSTVCELIGVRARTVYCSYDRSSTSGLTCILIPQVSRVLLMSSRLLFRSDEEPSVFTLWETTQQSSAAKLWSSSLQILCRPNHMKFLFASVSQRRVQRNFPVPH